MLRLLADPVLSANLAGAGLSLVRRELSFEEKSAIDQGALNHRARADVRARACERFAQ